jgi:drug/metabolite transporter (DMT)-like permease
MVPVGHYVKLHFVVFLWGFTAILGKLISLPAVEMVFFRTLLAALGMAIVILVNKGRLKVSRKDLVDLLLTGLLVSMHWIAFFGSARLANVSVSLVGFATASLWTSLLEPLTLGKKIKGFEVLLGSCVIAGIVIIFSFQHAYRFGFIVAIASGLLAALFSVINAKLIRRVNAQIITFYEMVGAALGIAIFAPLYTRYWSDDGVFHIYATGMDWLYLAILALVCTVYAFTVMVDLMKKVSVFFIQLTINLEPVYGIIMALLIFGDHEKMNANFYLGAFVILGAILSYPYLKRKYDKPFPSNG